MLNIFAPINLLGYGIHATNMIKALTDIGQELTLSKIGQVQNDPYFESYWKAAEANLIRFDSKNPSLYIFHDEYSFQASGKPLMVFSIFETSKLKPMSRQILNNGPADIILTTTDAHRTLLLENGITKPIQVVNEGVDDCIFNTIPTDKAVDTKKFTFITVGKREKRKSTDDIIYSFIEAMKDKEAALIAHTFNPFINTGKDHPFRNLNCWTGVDPQTLGLKYLGWMGKWHKFSNGNCDIYFTAPGFQSPELPTLYHSANVGIQMSKGEGWDLPLSEMMACGIPTIASMCLGHAEYLTDNTERIVPNIQSELIVLPNGKELAQDGVWFKGEQGEWSTFDRSQLVEKIKEVYENREKYEKKSEELSSFMADNYTWKKAAEKIITLY